MTPSQLIGVLQNEGFTGSEIIHIIATYVNVDIETLRFPVLYEYVRRWKQARKKFDIFPDEA